MYCVIHHEIVLLSFEPENKKVGPSKTNIFTCLPCIDKLEFKYQIERG